jgi:hypothetical protein
MRRWIPAFTAIFATAGALAGCGSDPTTFTAEEFVAEMNERGAGLVLGEPLLSAGGAGEVYELELAESGATGATGPEGVEGEHVGASVTVLEDPDAGLAEYERCESAATLLCFRVANVVMIFEGALLPADLERLESAVRAMESEE